MWTWEIGLSSLCFKSVKTIGTTCSVKHKRGSSSHGILFAGFRGGAVFVSSSDFKDRYLRSLSNFFRVHSPAFIHSHSPQAPALDKSLYFLFSCWSGKNQNNTIWLRWHSPVVVSRTGVLLSSVNIGLLKVTPYVDSIHIVEKLVRNPGSWIPPQT